MAMVELQKRPVAWRVKDYADGWVIFQDESNAQALAKDTGAVCQGLYVRVDSDPTRDEVREALYGKNPEVERTLMATRVANAAREEQLGWRDRRVDEPGPTEPAPPPMTFDEAMDKSYKLQMEALQALATHAPDRRAKLKAYIDFNPFMALKS